MLFILFILLSLFLLWLFIRGPYKYSPLWLMLAAWSSAAGISTLRYSHLELPWGGRFIFLWIISLISFTLGFFAAKKYFAKFSLWQKFARWDYEFINPKKLRLVIYFLFGASLVALYLFYKTTGNFPLLALSPDVFRFAADEKSPGLVNYCAQLARVFVPLAFFFIFYQGFNFKKHWDLIVVCVVGSLALTLFASRTQIYMIDLWVMALYLFMRRPNFKQALKFYPAFLFISVCVLFAIPAIRQNKSYGEDYLGKVTQIDYARLPKHTRFLLPIYIGVTLNQQALMRAEIYYLSHPLQYGRVTLDPFTNLLRLHSLKSQYDLGEIFQSWWNTGTYLFPFVQDFGDAAFFVVPFIIASILTSLWLYVLRRPNFLSYNLYAYACFFIAMTVYLSFTVRAEMYIDIFLVLVIYLFCASKFSLRSTD